MTAPAPDAAGWLPIDDKARNGENWLVGGHGIHHGLPFVARYEPRQFPPGREWLDQPWVTAIGHSRFYDHSLTHYQPVPALPSPPEVG